jgi:hypothetical protein
MKIDLKKSGSNYIRAADSASFRGSFQLTASTVHSNSYWSNPVGLEDLGRSTSINQGNLCVSSNPTLIAALTNSVSIPFSNFRAV